MVRWNVRPVAEARGIRTATELAERVGVNINTAMSLWGGRSLRVDRETLSKLCRALECQPGDLLALEMRADRIPGQAAAPVAVAGRADERQRAPDAPAPPAAPSLRRIQ